MTGVCWLNCAVRLLGSVAQLGCATCLDGSAALDGAPDLGAVKKQAQALLKKAQEFEHRCEPFRGADGAEKCARVDGKQCQVLNEAIKGFEVGSATLCDSIRRRFNQSRFLPNFEAVVLLAILKTQASSSGF